MIRKILLTANLILVVLSLPAANYFWIGGSGDWSDISHWATTSGGTITHSQAPTADDDVFFDANSFSTPGQTVFLNTDIIFCRNISWQGVTNAPTFEGGSNVTLNIFGSLELSAVMTFDFQGEIVFAASILGNTIDFTTHTAGTKITFSGTGDWTLSSPIVVDGDFFFNEGILQTAGQPIQCQYFESSNSANRTLNLDASTITTSGTTTPALRLKATNLTLNPGSSTFDLTAPNATIWLEGPGTIGFNRVILSSPAGNSLIRPYELNDDAATYPTVSYNELELLHLTRLNGNATIGNLILHPDQRYLFESGQTFVLGNLDAQGNCIKGITLEATDDGTAAIFESNNTINTDYISLRAIHGQGGGTFIADNAVDLGNTDGWNINPRLSQNLYWVGGSGNWDDPMHWSFSSGGPGSGCIPSAIDDVFFDANSFSAGGQSVTINIENAYCRNMDWTGATNNPSLAGIDNNTLRLSGSLWLISNMQHDFAGDYVFESDQTGNTITTAGQAFNKDLYFFGVNGEWTLLDEVMVEHFIYFTSGTLRTNNQSVTAEGFNAIEPFQRSLFLGSSYITVVDGWQTNATNLTFEAGMSTIECNGTGNGSTLLRNFGTGTMVYNNILFSAVRGDLRSQISTNTSPAVAIDSLIFLEEGTVSGNHNINFCQLSPGQSYELTNGAEQTINELNANGNCSDGLIYITTSSPGYLSYLNITNDHIFERLYLLYIEQSGSGQLQANNSIDGGGNINWSFTTTLERTLYWVGDAGDWNDPTHWSLSSGGPGGECIPTPVDDVIFDENSFSSGTPVISNNLDNDNYCRDMTWTAGVTGTPELDTRTLKIHGSLLIEGNLAWNVQFTNFNGSDDHTITTNGTVLSPVFFDMAGSYTLLDGFEASFIRLLRGTLNTNSQPVVASDFAVNSVANPMGLILGDSHLTFYGSNLNAAFLTFTVFAEGLVVEPGNSIIEFTHPNAGLRLDYPLNFHNVRFANPSGSGIIRTVDGTFNTISFFGDGTFVGSSIMDSLICVPGKTYTLESNNMQFINEHWRIIGNNCTPIELNASILGTLATVEMPASGNILADFIQMRDINGQGGADFFAGIHSTDIANSNVGWTFETAPEYIDVGFLGDDQALCSGAPITLNAYNYSPGETYLWQDGSTDSIFVADQAGSYFVEVEFLNNCLIRDTIEVLSPEDFSVNLPNDPVLCEGESIILDATIGINGASYSWQDGTLGSTFETNESGEYFVEVQLAGCIEADTTIVTVIEFPNIDLGPDLSLCEGQSFDLITTEMADTYLWQDGSSSANFSGNTAGVYWLEAANGNCAVRDSVIINQVPYPTVNLGPDTSLCEGQTLTLNANVDLGTFNWQDGSSGNTFLVENAGDYWLSADNQGCVTTDTITVLFTPVPVPDLGADQSLCEGMPFSLDANFTADDYEWQDGSTNNSFTGNAPGIYWVELTLGACAASDSVTIEYLDYPTVNLGPDTSLCEGQTLTLNANVDLGTFNWQDGSSGNTFLVENAGDYWLSADNQGCVTTDTITVLFTPVPVPDLGADQSLCEGMPFSLDANFTADDYEWQDGSTNNSFTGNAPGIYWVELTLGACAASDSVTIEYLDYPTVNLGPDTSLCEGQTLTLNANVGLGTFNWQDGSSGNTFLVENAGEYWLTADNQGCTTADTILVDVLDLPDLNLGPDQTACEGQTITLSAGVTADTYLWNNGLVTASLDADSPGLYWLEISRQNCTIRDSINLQFNSYPEVNLGNTTEICEGETLILEAGQPGIWQDGTQSETYEVTQSGIYTVSVANGDCVSDDSIDITVLDAPTIDLGPDLRACAGESIQLSVPTGISLFSWENGSIEPVRSLQESGTYWLEADENGCLARDSIEVIFAPLPTLDLGKDTTICDDLALVLRPQFSEGTLSWFDGSIGETYAVKEPGAIWAVLDNDGCEVRDTLFVTFTECLRFSAYIPNAFSPNSDGINDFFLPQFDTDLEILDYTLQIYNRWGDQLFLTHDRSEGWPGTFKGEVLGVDVFVYALEITYRDDFGERSEVLSGDVLLIK